MRRFALVAACSVVCCPLNPGREVAEVLRGEALCNPGFQA